MIVVEVGVKFMVAAPHFINHQNWVQNNSIFLKLIAKQLNISGFNG
jgi:hypothetical protein